MTNEELIQEMKEQALEDLLLGYRDHHQYDDAATTPGANAAFVGIAATPSTSRTAAAQANIASSVSSNVLVTETSLYSICFKL